MSLSALAGQSRAATLLGGALSSGRLHHAYLLAGPPGVGKTLAAELFARCLNCEGPAAVEAASHGAFVDEPCGRCASCHRITSDPRKHSHPLVMWIDTESAMEAQGLYQPEGGAPAKAIGVRLLREVVIPRLALKAIGGRRKVAIFRDAAFTDGAQNAFLKTLEEPPAETSFLILSSAPEILAVTIRSRCLRVPFSPLPIEVVAERVARERHLDPATARLCAAVSSGNLGLALEIDAASLQKRRDLILLLDRLKPDDWTGWLALAEMLADKPDALEALDIFETWFQDVALAAADGGPPATHLDLAAEAMAAARMGPAAVLRRIELIRAAREQIEANVQARLALERMVLEMNGIAPLALVPEAA